MYNEGTELLDLEANASQGANTLQIISNDYSYKFVFVFVEFSRVKVDKKDLIN